MGAPGTNGLDAFASAEEAQVSNCPPRFPPSNYQIPNHHPINDRSPPSLPIQARLAALQAAGVNVQATRHARRVYVGGFPDSHERTRARRIRGQRAGGGAFILIFCYFWLFLVIFGYFW